jgi:septal ring factor EnvC (AmiA/AmiB activator)
MSWSELLEKYGKVLGVLVAVAAAAWSLSQAAQVAPRDRDIASLKEQVAERDKIISKWEEAYEKLQKQTEPLYTNYKTLENNLTAVNVNLKQWQDALEGWRTQNTELQKQLIICKANGDILLEVRDLAKQKSRVDDLLGDRDPRGYTQQAYEAWKHESAGFQARTLGLQQKLVCEQK